MGHKLKTLSAITGRLCHTRTSLWVVASLLAAAPSPSQSVSNGFWQAQSIYQVSDTI
jgi:hypothetical protein